MLRVAGVALAVAAVACVGAWRLDSPLLQPDAQQYLMLAQGDPVMLPFASRQFGALVVRAIVHLFHVVYLTAFTAEGLVSLLVIAAVTTSLYLRRTTSWWLPVALGGMCFWTLQLNGLMMPDLFYGMLLCGLLLFLARGETLGAALMMFPLTVARESTLLTLFCFVVAGWKWLRKRDIAVAFAALAAGTVLVKHLTRNALPNKEHIDPSLYLIAKVPWNLLKNVFGIGMWANLYPACEVPRWHTNLHIGPLHALGFCGFYAEPPLIIFSFALAIFGLLPLLLARLGATRIRAAASHDLLLRFTVLYGGLSFLLAPVLGTTMTRLYGYAWPLFLVGLPLMLSAYRAAFRTTAGAATFLALHLFLAWGILWIPAGWLLITAVAIYAAGGMLLGRTLVLEPVQV